MNDELVIVVASIAAEKVAETALDEATPVAPEAGLIAVTDGPALAVVKLHETALANAVPSAALIVAARLAVYDVPAANTALGVNVATLLVAS